MTIQCAIRYAEVDDQMRYCVRPAGKEADPIKPLREDERPSDRAEWAEWAHAGAGTFAGPGERALEQCSFDLVWRPRGNRNREVLLFEERPHEQVWKTEASEGLPYKRWELPRKIATLMTARFWEAGLTFQDRDPLLFDDPWTPEAAREDPQTVPDAKLSPVAANWHPPSPNMPMPDPDTAWPMEAKSSGTPAKGVPSGPRWVTVLRRWENPEKGPSGTEGLQVLPNTADTEVMAVYKVTGDGTYKLASFGSGAAATPDGSPESDVMLPVKSRGEDLWYGEAQEAEVGTLFARLSMVPPTKKRLRQQVRCLRQTLDEETPTAEKAGHSFTPLYLDQLFAEDGPAEFKQAAAPEQTSKGPGGAVRLPNPLGAAQRRFDRAKQAKDRFETWTDNAKGTADLVGLVGDTCFSGNHGRTYLQSALKKTEDAEKEMSGTTDGGEEKHPLLPWRDTEEQFLPNPRFSLKADEDETFGGALSGPVSEWGADNSLLGEVLYGLRCQRVLLRKKRDRAVQATRTAIRSAPMRDLLYEAKGHPAAGPAKEVGQKIVFQHARLAGVGGGGYLTQLIHDCLGEYPRVEKALAALGGGETAAKKDEQSGAETLLIEDPRFKALFALARRTAKGGEQLVAGSAPGVLAAAYNTDSFSTKGAMPAHLAFLGGLLAGPETKKVEIEKGSSVVKGPGGRVSFTTSDVDGLGHRGTDAGRQWQLDKQSAQSLSTTFVESAGKVGLTPKRMKGAAVVLDVLNVAISGTELMAKFEDGRLAPKDGLATAKFLADGADLTKRALEGAKTVDDLPAGVKSSVKVLAKAGPVLDTVTIAWNVASALSHNRKEGLQQVRDPNYVGAVGAVASGVGTMVLTGSLLTGGAGLPILAGAGAMALCGAGLGWYQRWENVQDHRKSDPLIEWTPDKDDGSGSGAGQEEDEGLFGEVGEWVEESTDSVVGEEAAEAAGDAAESGLETASGAVPPLAVAEEAYEEATSGTWTGWLAEQSQWGKDHEGAEEVRQAFRKLATPKKGQSVSPPAKPVKDETEQFVQKAFTFPTAVGVPPKPALDLTDWTSGAPKRLFLSIIPKYVPKKRGTFMVSGRLIPTAPGATETAVPIECAVHYVEVEDDIRYSVLPPETSVGLEGSLKETAKKRNWAIARNEDTPVPGGGTDRKIHLPIHVGYWPVRTGDPEGQSRLRNKWKDARDRGLVRARSEMESAGRRQAAARQQRAAQELSQVHWTSQMPPPENFESILKSGHFEVNGTISFNPLQPFDPSPNQKKYKGEETPIAKEDIKFQYPRDASK